MSNASLFFPQVTQLPKVPSTGESGLKGKLDPALKGEFQKTLDQALGGSVAQPLKFSAHAMERVRQRSIDLNPDMMSRISQAVSKAEQKGITDSLIITDDSAWIVSVKNRTVVTALDKDMLTGNVFTNIDGAVIA